MYILSFGLHLAKCNVHAQHALIFIACTDHHHDSGKFCLVSNCHSPAGPVWTRGSIQTWYHTFIVLNDVAKIVQKLSTGALLTKMAIESLYRLITVHPRIASFKSMNRKERLMWTPCLSCGLVLHQRLGNAVADAIVLVPLGGRNLLCFVLFVW